MTELNLVDTKVSKAVEAISQLSAKLKKKEPLVEEAEVVQLQICVKKIPPQEKTIKLRLPHSLRQADSDICLFVKDLDKTDREYEATVHHFQDVLRKRGVKSIPDIIPLKSLKTEYKPYEAKRNLSNAYDIFLADSRIMRLLPSYLGKHFYGKKKAPVQVNLQAKDLSRELTSAMDRSSCVISGKGASSVATVAHMQMSQAEVTENVISSAKQIAAAVAGGVANVKQLSIKTKQSTSIPIYLAQGGPQEVNIPKKAKPQAVEAEEISTLFGAKVKVFPSGYVKIIKDGGNDDQPQKRQRKTSKSKKALSGSKQKTTKKTEETQEKMAEKTQKEKKPSKKRKTK